MRSVRRVLFESEPDVSFTRENGRTNKGERGERAKDQRIGASGRTATGRTARVECGRKKRGGKAGAMLTYQNKIRKIEVRTVKMFHC